MDLLIQTKLEKLFANASTRLYAKGDTITLAGHDPEGVMLIDSGDVEQYDLTSAGEKIIINRFKPKAFFPMSWAINKTPNTYFYSATSNVTIRCLPADTVIEFIKHNPDVMFDLLSRVYKGTDGILQRLVLTSCGGALDRVIFELLNEAYRFGRTQDESSWRLIKIKQQNLAQRCGLARETVSRELKQLEKAGLIIHAGQGLSVCVDQLEAKLT